MKAISCSEHQEEHTILNGMQGLASAWVAGKTGAADEQQKEGKRTYGGRLHSGQNDFLKKQINFINDSCGHMANGKNKPLFQ